MKYLLHLILTIILAPFHTPSQGEVIDRASSSIVRVSGVHTVTDPNGFVRATIGCTGFVIAPQRVLTANHCLEQDPGTPIYVDGAVAKVLKQDDYFDLALLEAPTSKPVLHFSDVLPTRLQEITGIGYGGGLRWLLYTMNRIVLVDYQLQDFAPGMVVYQPFIQGMSGGPAIDKEGKVVMMIQRSAATTGYGVGVATMKVFLLGTE